MRDGMETYKSLACPALSHFLACLTLPLLGSQLGSVAGRADEAFLLFRSPLPHGSLASGQGSAVTSTQGKLLPADLLWPLKATCACLLTGTAELRGHDRR